MKRSLRCVLQTTVPMVMVAWLLGASFVAHAEVAVALRANAQQVEIATPYILGIIVDDPDPTTTWLRYNAESPNRRILNENGHVNGDGRPSMISNGFSKLPIVAWSRNSPSGFDVVVSQFAGGAWSAPTVVAGSTADELDPVLAMDPADGTVHLVYWINDGQPRVMHLQAPADLSSWSTPVQVSEVGDLSVRPSIVIESGARYIAYESHGATFPALPHQIVMARDDGPGFAYELVGATLHTEPNQVQVHCTDNKLWVDWVEAEGEMDWRLRTAPQVWETIQAEPFETIEQRDYHVRGSIKAQALE